MVRRGSAAFLAGILIAVSPGIASYQAFAAVRVAARVSGVSLPGPAGSAGLASRGLGLPAASASLRLSPSLVSRFKTISSPGLNSPFPELTILSKPEASTQLRSARPVVSRALPSVPGAARGSPLSRILSQSVKIAAVGEQVSRMPAAGAHSAGARLMDGLLGIRSHAADGGDPLGSGFESFEPDFGLEDKHPLSESGSSVRMPDREDPPPPPRDGEPLSPTTAGGQLFAGIFTGGLAAGAYLGAKHLAAMSLAGWLGYAPLAADIAAVAAALMAAGFLFLGTRIALARGGSIESGDTTPMEKPYKFFTKGAVRSVFLKPVQGEKPVYIPSYAAWTLRLHSRVRAQAGRFAAYFVQSFANSRLLFGEALALARGVISMGPLIAAMYRGDAEVRPYVKTHRKSLHLLQGINIVQAVMGVATSFVVGALVDAAIAKTMPTALLMAGAMVAFAAVNLVLNTAYAWTKSRLTSNVLSNFRVHLFGHLLTLPFGFFNREKPSEVSARLSVDVAQLAAKNIGIPVIIPYYGAMALFAGIMMGITSLEVSSLLLAVVPLLALIAAIYGNKVERLNEAQFSRRAQMISSGEETLSQLRDVRSFSAEKLEKKRYASKVDSFIGTLMRKSRIASSYNGGMDQSYQLVFYLAVLFIGLFSFILSGAPTVGQTMALVGYAGLMKQALKGSLSLYTQYRETTGSARRVLDYLKEKRALNEPSDALDPGRLEGAVSFEGVDFSYDGKRSVLKAIDFDVSPGRHVALVGEDAEAKSAFLDLVARLDDPAAGKVLFDGKDAAGLQLSHLRRQISLLHDRGIWLDGMSARENLTYGLERGIADERIIEALKESGAEFLLNEFSFPEGLDTVLELDDWRLTPMRKRLLEIARAALADPRIILYDRPSAGLDDSQAGIVDERLAALRRGRTAFTVDRRVSAAQNADLIFVLKGGEIVERGTHAELLALKGVYFGLWKAEQAKTAAEEPTKRRGRA